MHLLFQIERNKNVNGATETKHHTEKARCIKRQTIYHQDGFSVKACSRSPLKHQNSFCVNTKVIIQKQTEYSANTLTETRYHLRKKGEVPTEIRHVCPVSAHYRTVYFGIGVL